MLIKKPECNLTVGYITGLKRLPKDLNELQVKSLVGFPEKGIIRIMPENRLYLYSGVVPIRSEKQKPTAGKKKVSRRPKIK